MVFRILVDGYAIWDPSYNDGSHRVLAPVLTKQVNRTGKLTFTVPKDNEWYSSLHLLTSTVKAFADDNCIFLGRIISIKRDWYNNKVVECEDYIGLLNDVVIAPVTLTDWSDVTTIINDAMTAQKFSSRQLQLISFPSGSCSEEITYYQTAYKFLNWACNEKMNMDGQFVPVITLDLSQHDSSPYRFYINMVWTTTGQTIEFGVNLLDFQEQIDGTEVYTGIYPVGADGLTLSDPIVWADVALQSRYDKIVKQIDYPQAMTEAALQTYAENDLDMYAEAASTLTLTAVDMSLAGVTTPMFEVGSLIHCISKPHGYDETVQCKKIILNLEYPERSKYTFGRTQYGISSMV